MNQMPLNMRNMVTDHVLPESLLQHPEELASILATYGLPPTFNLNSYKNWLPACERCNRDKSSKPFRATPIVQIYLERARAKAVECVDVENTIENDKKAMKAINLLLANVEAGSIHPDDLQPLIDAISRLKSRHPNILDPKQWFSAWITGSTDISAAAVDLLLARVGPS
jgi:hypothetical protein